MLTARDGEADLEIGLAVGGDDYMVKPFSPRELVARIRGAAAAKPTPRPPAPSDQIRLGRLVIDPPTRHSVLDGDETVHLTPTEFDLLHRAGAPR